jgi:hypothetical protein
VRLATLCAKHAALASVFTERSRRSWAATEARALGHGGIGLVERATGISRPTIQRGLRELDAQTSLPPGRSRRPGGGRKSAIVLDATLPAGSGRVGGTDGARRSGLAAAVVL